MVGEIQKEDGILAWVFLLLAGIVLPLVLIPVEKFLNYPYLIEEVIKAGVILFAVWQIKNTRTCLWAVIIFGILFAISESIFYSGGNLVLSGTLTTLGERLLFTIPLHLGTALLIFLSAFRDKRWIITGLLGAVVIHYLFNFFVG